MIYKKIIQGRFIQDCCNDYFPFYFRLSPPYHVYVISLLTFLLLQYNWISCIQYSYRVAPPTLVATVIALNSCFQNMLGNLNK